MRWLHSVEEVEVPEGLFSGVYQKREERKGKASSKERPPWRWFDISSPMKLPIQAVAMVAILFLAIYLTKMVPMETPRLKEAMKEKPPETSRPNEFTEKKPPETPGRLAKKVDKPLLTPKRVIEESKPVPSEEKKVDTLVVQEEKLGEREEKAGKMAMPQAAASLEPRPPQEIVLRAPDREKALSQLQTLLKQYSGEIVTTEESIVLVSLPRASLPEFEEALLRLGSGDRAEPHKEARERLKAAAPRGPLVDTKDRISLRIVIVQE